MASLEEIAPNKNWITKEDLERIITSYKNTEYAKSPKKYYKYQKKVIHLGSNTIHMPELVEFFEKKFKSENHHFFLSSKGIEKKLKVI